MRILIPLIFFLFSSFLSAQAYVPLPTDSVKWTDGYSSFNGCTPTPCCFYTDYMISKDTLIGSFVYHKIRDYSTDHPGCGDPNFPPFNFAPRDAGYFRNDSINKKVWFKAFPSSPDTLLYDFDLSVNQLYPVTYLSVNPTPEYRVDSIKTATYFGQNRREYYMSVPGFAGQEVTLVEGIGASTGFLNTMLPIGLGYNYFAIDFCWQELDKDLQPCALTVGLKEQHSSKADDWTYYYNSNIQSIVFSSPEKLNRLLIYNLSGQKVGEYRPEYGQVRVDLKKGIYFLQAIDPEGRIHGGKLAVNN